MRKKQETKSAPQKVKSKPKEKGLNALEKKRLKELKGLLASNSKKQKAVDTAQKTITFQKMYRDGICHVKQNLYSRMVEFNDINYKLLEEKERE